MRNFILCFTICLCTVVQAQDSTNHRRPLHIELEARSGLSWCWFNDWAKYPGNAAHYNFYSFSLTSSLNQTVFAKIYHSNLYHTAIGTLDARSGYHQTDISFGYEHCFAGFFYPRIGGGLSIRKRYDEYIDGYVNQGWWTEVFAHSEAGSDIGLNIFAEANFKYYIFTIGGFLTSRFFFAGNPVTLELGPHAGLILPCYREGWLTPRKRAALAKAKHH